MSLVDLQISVLATEYVKTQVTGVVDGATVNPTSGTVSMAFSTIGSDPANADWKSGSWETRASKYFARCLVGPGGVGALAKGVYEVWVKIVYGSETVVKAAGVLEAI